MQMICKKCPCAVFPHTPFTPLSSRASPLFVIPAPEPVRGKLQQESRWCWVGSCFPILTASKQCLERLPSIIPHHNPVPLQFHNQTLPFPPAKPVNVGFGDGDIIGIFTGSGQLPNPLQTASVYSIPLCHKLTCC